MARGAIGQANINARELRSVQLPVPPLGLQRRYAETVEAARAVVRVRESGTRTAAALMASLMSELLRNDVSARGTRRAETSVLDFTRMPEWGWELLGIAWDEVRPYVTVRDAMLVAVGDPPALPGRPVKFDVSGSHVRHSFP